MLNTGIKGFNNHTVPFHVGDVEPQKTFVHVLDDDSLHILMSARDTLSDFVSYLTKREKLFRGQTLISAAGEEQLLAIYLKSLNQDNEHDFIFFGIPPGQAPGKIFIAEGHWEDFKMPPRESLNWQLTRLATRGIN